LKNKLIIIVPLLLIANVSAMISVKNVEKNQEFTITLSGHKKGKGKMLLDSEDVQFKKRDFLRL
jgi:hypothetical protein